MVLLLHVPRFLNLQESELVANWIGHPGKGWTPTEEEGWACGLLEQQLLLLHLPRFLNLQEREHGGKLDMPPWRRLDAKLTARRSRRSGT